MGPQTATLDFQQWKPVKHPFHPDGYAGHEFRHRQADQIIMRRDIVDHPDGLCHFHAIRLDADTGNDFSRVEHIQIEMDKHFRHPGRLQPRPQVTIL